MTLKLILMEQKLISTNRVTSTSNIKSQQQTHPSDRGSVCLCSNTCWQQNYTSPYRKHYLSTKHFVHHTLLLLSYSLFLRCPKSEVRGAGLGVNCQVPLPKRQYCVSSLGFKAPFLPQSMLFCTRLKYERDLVVNLKHEEEKLTAVLEREEKDIKRLMEVINMIDR